MDKSITISKLDAAKRQLEAFIRMYFNDGDPVAMHTLVGAAYGVVSDLNSKRGGQPTFQESLLDRVIPEYRAMVRKKLGEAQNFFKHADRDHDASLDFNPDATEMLAFDACKTYSELTGEIPPLLQIFNGWIMISHPQFFKLSDEQRHKQEVAGATFLREGKAAYFNTLLPAVMKRGT